MIEDDKKTSSIYVFWSYLIYFQRLKGRWLKICNIRPNLFTFEEADQCAAALAALLRIESNSSSEGRSSFVLRRNLAATADGEGSFENVEF